MPCSQKKSTRLAPRRPEPTISAPPKSTRWAARSPESTMSAPPPVPKRPKRSVAMWARQEGQEVPRYFVSDAPWKTQRRIRRDLPLDHVPWPFRGCTLVDIEKAAGGIQLPTDAAVEFCATCRVTVHYQCHYKGIMHVARTKAAAEGMATTGAGCFGTSPAQPALGHRPGGPVPTANGGGPPFRGTAFRAATARNQRRATDERRRHNRRGPSVRTRSLYGLLELAPTTTTNGGTKRMIRGSNATGGKSGDIRPSHLLSSPKTTI
ncbi:hypothetical protein HPB51_007889 [Rhipicephalus microplus]|uniref:Uncharacterized protein n=1 Tax=Rhipicephalus microplus TaxID=6941 RepID=A0A9J6ENI0_RHIMP|nr:hypothetical protein HPB51_007889 [Rhipicephalus microplus]